MTASQAVTVSKLIHLYRRKALYYWRRRLPPLLRNWFYKRHLFLSLRTADPTFARRLVVLLDAKLEEIVTAFEQSTMHLTPPQVDGLLRDVVTTHLSKLERLSAAAKSFPEFDPAQAKHDDRRAAADVRGAFSGQTGSGMPGDVADRRSCALLEAIFQSPSSIARSSSLSASAIIPFAVTRRTGSSGPLCFTFTSVLTSGVSVARQVW
jgi:hypothetical protein